MVRNEAHTNNGSGLHSWHNIGPEFAVVDFRAWRNGFAGIKWGAYGNRMHVYRAALFENGTYNLQTTAVRIFPSNRYRPVTNKTWVRHEAEASAPRLMWSAGRPSGALP